MIENKTDVIASTYLGKKSEISNKYDPSVIVPIPRAENRNKYSIDSSTLPFEGYDVWHCYEFSTLLNNGVPVARVLKLKYSANSEYIVESKSLKLYLNSFNMSCWGDSIEDCLRICKSTIENDLSKRLCTSVKTEFLCNARRVNIFSNYNNILDFADYNNIKITDFKENSSLLKVAKTNTIKEYFLNFDSLRSNCRVTHQPDFGDVFIYYKSKNFIDYNSLLKYLVSFRNEYHFHEECCEMIYKRLHDLLNEEDLLMVCALYTRRGGIDISPVRYSNGFMNDDIKKLIDLGFFARYGIKQ